jgi:hypothetical protein
MRWRAALSPEGFGAARHPFLRNLIVTGVAFSALGEVFIRQLPREGW